MFCFFPFSNFDYFCRFENEFGGVESLQSELEDLKQHLSKLGSPVVMCHNDLLLANVILDPSHDKVTFIDYEYAGMNYQAFDIGNHFAEFAGTHKFCFSGKTGLNFTVVIFFLYLIFVDL